MQNSSYEESGFDTAADNGDDDETVVLRAEEGGVDAHAVEDDGEGDDTVMVMLRRSDGGEVQKGGGRGDHFNPDPAHVWERANG